MLCRGNKTTQKAKAKARQGKGGDPDENNAKQRTACSGRAAAAGSSSKPKKKPRGWQGGVETSLHAWALTFAQSFEAEFEEVLLPTCAAINPSISLLSSNVPNYPLFQDSLFSFSCSFPLSPPLSYLIFPFLFFFLFLFSFCLPFFLSSFVIVVAFLLNTLLFHGRLHIRGILTDYTSSCLVCFAAHLFFFAPFLHISIAFTLSLLSPRTTPFLFFCC